MVASWAARRRVDDSKGTNINLWAFGKGFRKLGCLFCNIDVYSGFVDFRLVFERIFDDLNSILLGTCRCVLKRFHGGQWAVGLWLEVVLECDGKWALVFVFLGLEDYQASSVHRCFDCLI